MAKNMKNPEDRTLNSDRFSLPYPNFSESAHLSNIEYCINFLLNYEEKSSKPVLGYSLARSIGTIHTFYRLMSQESAEELKKTNPRFIYITLDDLVSKKREIIKGKYILNDSGLIVDKNPIYSSI